MEIPVPSLENIKAAWDWSLQQLQLWSEVVRKPSEVVKSIDLNSTDSLGVALKFAIFPTCLASIIALPTYLLTKDASLGIIGYLIVSIVVSAVQVFVFAASQRVSAIILRGRGSLLASTISTLYATAFGPLVELVNLFGLNQSSLHHNESLDPFVGFLYGLAAIALVIYLTLKFVPMTRVVHKVGRVRATMICWLTMLIGGAISLALLQPMLDKMFGLA